MTLANYPFFEGLRLNLRLMNPNPISAAEFSYRPAVVEEIQADGEIRVVWDHTVAGTDAHPTSIGPPGCFEVEPGP